MILDRYLLRLWAAPFVGGLVLVVSVLVLSRALRLLDMATDFAGVWTFLAQMLVLTLPYFSLIAVPIAFFLALQSVLVGLQTSSEMDAMRAAGISYARMLRAPFAVAVLLWLGLSYVAMVWLPASQLQFNNILRQIYAMKGSLGAVPQQFSEQAEDFSLYVDGEEGGGVYRGIVLEDRRSPVPVIYVAERARFAAHEGRLRIELEDGARFEGRGASQRMLAFDRYQVTVALQRAGWQRARPKDDPTMMGPGLLWQAATAGNLKARVELARRLMLPSVVLVLFLLALPVSIVRKRSGRSGAFLMGILALVLIYNLELALHRLALGGRLPVAGMVGGHFVLIAAALFAARRAALDRPLKWLALGGQLAAEIAERVTRWISLRRGAQ